MTSKIRNKNKASQPSSTAKNSQVSSPSGIPSTLNGPSGLLIGERNSSMVAPTKIQSNNRHRASSNTRDSRSSSKPSVPSTLNGPPGLLIGERKNENQTRLLQLTTNLSATQRSSHESNEAQSRSVLVVQDRCNRSYSTRSIYRT